MNHRNTLLRWTSTRGPIRLGAELRQSALAGRSLDKALTEAVGRASGAQFLILSITSLDLSRVPGVVEAYQEAGGTARLCLASHRRTLNEIDALGLDNDRVGLMLDDVDADTSWTDFAWDRIEAVRFSANFLDHAGRDMRTGCILESMLALSREIGMRTFGYSQTPNSASVLGRYDFDYSPMAADAGPESGIPRPATQASRSGHSVAAGR